MKTDFTLGLFFGILVVACIVAGFYLNTKTVQVQNKVYCREFPSQAEAQKVYQEGARYLDADGDGIACESLL